MDGITEWIVETFGAAIPAEWIIFAVSLLPLLELHCAYGLPAHYEDRLIVRTQVGLLKPSRVRFDYEIRRAGTDKPLNTGWTLHAFTDPSLRPISLKKHAPEIYGVLERAMEG